MKSSIVNCGLKLAIFFTLLTIIACSYIPVTQVRQEPDKSQVQQIHTRKVSTPPYVGNRSAIVFIISQIDNSLKSATDQIIRIFGRQRVAVEVALPPLPGNGSYDSLKYLQDFVDAGMINICFDGNSIAWLEADTSKNDPLYGKLIDDLSKYRKELTDFFGHEPMTCLLPDLYFSEINYSAILAAGFRVIATGYQNTYNPSVDHKSQSIMPDSRGIYYLPIVATLDYSLPPPRKGKANEAINTAILSRVDKAVESTIDQTLDRNAAAAVEILPSSFINTNGEVDPLRISQLYGLIKTLQLKGDITSAEDWYSYQVRWTEATTGKRIMPAYNGGPAIIFRLDDVAKGYYEDVVREIILLFEKNNVPLDLGIVSNADGADSYDIPWIKDYLNRGVVGISVHGYDWEFYQLDTARSQTEYTDIKLKLRKARDSYAKYFGLDPVALTVPTDSWDRMGYLAVQDAGFKIFSTHITEEPNPSVEPVDVDGHKNPAGMYRIPTASDVCEWDETRLVWGNVIDISRPAGIADYCRYHAAYEEQFYNEIGTNLCYLLGYLGVAAITIHPDAFVRSDGTIDKEKIALIQPIINWTKKQGTITTFEQWYNYSVCQKSVTK